MPVRVSGAENENICRLVGVLKQPGCCALFESPRVHARVLHRAGNRPF